MTADQVLTVLFNGEPAREMRDRVLIDPATLRVLCEMEGPTLRSFGRELFKCYQTIGKGEKLEVQSAVADTAAVFIKRQNGYWVTFRVKRQWVQDGEPHDAHKTPEKPQMPPVVTFTKGQDPD